MAYVVARGKRFEIRESLQTAAGPRARSLANFSQLTDRVLGTAEARASRPFDRTKVLASAARAGAPMSVGDYSGFVNASRRLGGGTDGPPDGPRIDPGRALIELLGFAERVSSSLPPRSPEPLDFPVLAQLIAKPA